MEILVRNVQQGRVLLGLVATDAPEVNVLMNRLRLKRQLGHVCRFATLGLAASVPRASLSSGTETGMSLLPLGLLLNEHLGVLLFSSLVLNCGHVELAGVHEQWVQALLQIIRAHEHGRQVLVERIIVSVVTSCLSRLRIWRLCIVHLANFTLELGVRQPELSTIDERRRVLLSRTLMTVEDAGSSRHFILRCNGRGAKSSTMPHVFGEHPLELLSLERAHVLLLGRKWTTTRRTTRTAPSRT